MIFFLIAAPRLCEKSSDIVSHISAAEKKTIKKTIIRDKMGVW